MALQFICDICGDSYKARIGLNNISYATPNGSVIIDRETEPCDKCRARIEEAENAEIEKIKQEKENPNGQPTL